MNTKLISESCERNKLAILQVIKPLLLNVKTLLEIGSGTGQHAVYFSCELPDLHWQTSDLQENHQNIRLWLEEFGLINVLPPLTLDVLTDEWPEQRYDAAYSANTAHIMSWKAVEALFSGVARQLNPGGLFILYGPFNYQGKFTSYSNQQFERWLKARDPEMGIKDFEDLQVFAGNNALSLIEDHAMPSNNRILVWQNKS